MLPSRSSETQKAVPLRAILLATILMGVRQCLRLPEWRPARWVSKAWVAFYAAKVRPLVIRACSLRMRSRACPSLSCMASCCS